MDPVRSLGRSLKMKFEYKMKNLQNYQIIISKSALYAICF